MTVKGAVEKGFMELCRGVAREDAPSVGLHVNGLKPT